MLFDVRTVTRGTWDVVQVVGDVDLATIPSLRAHLDQVRGDRVALDLGGVDLFDPLGFGLVIAASLRARRRGAQMVVVCPPGRPRELFAESGVDRILTVVDSLDDAGSGVDQSL
jgi:anti-sigma B factor antagonist